MVIGVTPFVDRDIKRQNEKIKFARPKFPDYLSDTLKNLLENLLKKDPSKRTGSSSPSEIKNHPWFKDVDWERLLAKEYTAFFSPIDFKKQEYINQNSEFAEAEFGSTSTSSGRKIYPLLEGKFCGFLNQGFSYNKGLKMSPKG